MATLSPSPPLRRSWAGRPRRRSGRDWLLVVLSTVIALGLLAPLALIALDARSAGWGEIHRVLFRARSVMLLRHTVVLALIVGTLAAAIGTATAWLTERTALRARRVWTVLLVLPVAIPDFVVGYAWHSFAPRLNPLLGASIVMTLGTYPLVYLPVAAALRRSDPAMEEAAHSLGVGRLAAFRRVTLPLIRTAVLGGCVLVVLTVISEYGAFEILRYQTFTTEIFTEFQFDAQAAGALSIPLVCLGLLALFVEGLVPRRRTAQLAPQRKVRRAALGRLSIPVLLALGGLVVLGVGVPVGTIIYWIAQSQHTTLPATATLASATWTTLTYSAWGAGVAVVLAVPVALMSLRRSSVTRTVLERSTYVTKGAARCGDRPQPGVLRDPIRIRPVRDERVARGRLRDSELPARAGVRENVGRADPSAPDRRGPLARARADLRVLPGHAPAAGPRAAGRLLPGVPDRRDRADGDARPGADRGRDAGHAVLGLPTERRLWSRGAIRAGDRRAGAGAGRPAGAMV